MSAMKCMSALHGCLLKESMVAPFFAMFILVAFMTVTFSIFGWVRISIVEAGAITSILFSSWAGADHEILCCTLLSPCRVAAYLTLLLGPESDVADKSRLCFCNAPRSYLRRPHAAEVHLAVIVIMI